MRHDAVEHIRTNSEFFKFYIEDDEPIEEYLKTMSKDGVWGGQLEMTALAEKLRFNVVVHQVDAPSMQQEFNPPMGSVPTLHISYHMG